MELTKEIKEQIDSFSYEELLKKWRFATSGDPIFQGASGFYYAERMLQLRNEEGGLQRHVRTSKAIGWK